jgi:hypothetical protein
MRYLKLYEAFSSNTLSKLYKHLKKKNASNKSLNQFKEDMGVIAKSFDIPMDKISDEDVSYISRRKALPLRSEAKNDSGIWAIKFWFDKDGEYIGTSGTGNAKFATSLVPNSGSFHSKPYSKAQWDKIKKSMTYGFPKTGYLIPVLHDEYDQLKTGDEVIACLCDPEEYDDYPESKVDRLICGKIFLDYNGQVYFIHDDDIADGSSPNNSPSEEYPDIEWGDYTWSIASSNKNPGSDHFNLHKVIKSDAPISYYSEKNNNEEEVGKNPFEFNLSLEEVEENKLILSDWSANIDEKNKIEKEADFAVILYVDGILSRGLKSKSATSEERKETRKGAIALMSDEDFKQANIEKYLKQLVEKIGITPESVELKNLQKVAATIMSTGISDSYALFSIMSRDYRAIDNLTYQLKRLISSVSLQNPEMIKFVYNEFVSDYRRTKKHASDAYKSKKASMDMLKEREYLKPLYDSILRISNKISKGIVSKEITRGEDLKKILFKLESIESMMRDDDFELSRQFRDFSENVRYGVSDSDMVIRRLENMDGDYSTLTNDNKTTLLEMDLKNLKEIESYVDDLFKK